MTARRVRQANTRRRWEMHNALIVAQESTLQPEVQHRATHAADVLQTPTHWQAAGLWRVVSVTQALLDRMAVSATTAWPASTR